MIGRFKDKKLKQILGMLWWINEKKFIDIFELINDQLKRMLER